jgi:para-nitrobenzyl esterase
MTSRLRRIGIRLLGAGVAAVLLATVFPLTAKGSGGGHPVVLTDRGAVQGVVAEGVRTFAGIPYAAPPVGELRWQAPRPMAPWPGVRDAAEPGSPCAQKPGEVPNGSVNEDCLYLNVTTPATEPRARRPVVVWLHGGGFTGGAGSSYDAKRLALKGDVVVVTINYRLGVFGNLAYPGLKDGGTFGLLDQLAALAWVRRNAAAFGGDPRNVSAAGESAGAMSICALLTSPKTKGTFDKAVMESGSCLLDWTRNTWYPGMPSFTPYVSTQEANAQATAAAAALGCTDPATAPACLRGKSAGQLLASEQPFNAPVYGNALLPRHPAEALRSGRFHRIPLLSGGNRDEANGSAAAYELADHVTDADYQGLLRETFGTDADRIAARYPSNAYDSPAAAWGAVATDRAWACPTLEGNRLLAERTPTYAFEFADRTAPNLGLPTPEGFPLGATHAFELPYLFDLGGSHLLQTPAQERLADQMIGYWSNFARTGNPNGPGLPLWLPMLIGNSQTLESGPGRPGPVDLSTRHNCDLWKTIEERAS